MHYKKEEISNNHHHYIKSSKVMFGFGQTREA
jgi:hypothetical protein